MGENARKTPKRFNGCFHALPHLFVHVLILRFRACAWYGEHNEPHLSMPRTRHGAKINVKYNVLTLRLSIFCYHLIA